MQVLGSVVVCAWTLVFAVAAFWALTATRRIRVEQAVELAGIDNVSCKLSHLYNQFAAQQWFMSSIAHIP